MAWSIMLGLEEATIPGKRQDRSPTIAAGGQSGASAQVLDAEQKKAAAAASGWFALVEQAPDSGEIDSHHTLFTLLHRIYSKRLTGKLQLVFGRVEKALFFDGGHLVFASSGDSQDGLGEVMLRAGALTQSQFEEASTLVETGQRFGSAIAEMGIYGVQEIVGWVRRQVIQVVASVLDFPAGRYFFFASLEKNVVPEIGTPVPLGKLLLEAVRKASDLPLDRLAADGELRVEKSSDPLRLFKEVELGDGERQLLKLSSQKVAAKEILSQSGLAGAEAARALYALLLLGAVVGTQEVAKVENVAPEAERVIPPSPVKVEVTKAVEAPAAASDVLPQSQESRPAEAAPVETRRAEPPAQAPETTAVEAASVSEVTHAQPQLEEIPQQPEVQKEMEAAPMTPVPLLKPNMISRQVAVRVTGIPLETNERGQGLFNEDTTSVLVAETAGVIRLSGTVAAGHLLVLANLDTKREVIVQVVRKRVCEATSSYVELEFAEAAPGFWGIEFSAATALLPKSEQDLATAAMVIAAAATADQPWVLPPAPGDADLQAFKREMDGRRGRPVSAETSPVSAQANALAQLSAEVGKAAPITGPGDPLSTEAILYSGVDAAGAEAPMKRDTPLGAPWESGVPNEAPQSMSDFIDSMPKSKRWRMPRGGFTPEFNRVLLGLGMVIVVLVVGLAWFKHWLPWQWAGAKATKYPAGGNMRVASDAPVTSAGIREKSAPASNPDAPASANGTEILAEGAAASASSEQPISKKNAAGKTPAGKASPVRPAAKPVSNADATAVKESALVPPKLLHSEQAVASLEALRDFERGNVVIDAVVGTSGEVHFISVISGPPSLRAAAVESLKQYKYEPATRNGQPVPAHVTITIHFRFEP